MLKSEQTDESEDLTEAINHYLAVPVLTSCLLDHPSRPVYLSNLAEVLVSRFKQSCDLSGVKDAATLRQESLGLLDKENPDRMWILMNLANVYHSRSMQTYDPEDLGKAISRYREVLLMCPPDHEDKDKLLKNLGFLLITRFENFGHMDCLEEATSFIVPLFASVPGVTHVDNYRCVDSPTPCMHAAIGHIELKIWRKQLTLNVKI